MHFGIFFFLEIRKTIFCKENLQNEKQQTTHKDLGKIEYRKCLVFLILDIENKSSLHQTYLLKYENETNFVSEKVVLYLKVDH